VTGGGYFTDALETLGGLARAEQAPLRDLLVAATAGDGGRTTLERLVGAAPIHALPAAALLHRVSGSVRRGLDGVDGVPPDVVDQLEAEEGAASFHHLVVVGALSLIATAFDDAGLSWAVMKGPVVATLLYPSVGDRRYGDLDLLVHPRDFGAAMRILESLGYEHTIHDWARAEQMMAGEIGMAGPSVLVDLHWHLHYSTQDRRPLALDPLAMLGRVRRVDVSGLEVPTFDPVDTLVTLAFHAARSDGHRLIWLKDIERSLAVEQPDLGEVVRRAQAARCAPPVGLMLSRARRVLDAQVPSEVVDAMTPPSLRAIDRLACALVDPIQLDERETVTRALTRSARSSLLESVTDIPARSVRWARQRFTKVPANETDDPTEKARYVRAVAASAR